MSKTKIEHIGITIQTFWHIVNEGGKGDGALKLYMFYVQKAIDQNTIQPWATDAFCARRLRCNVKSIRSWRKDLQKLGIVEHIQKSIKGRTYFFVKVNYLTVQITGKALHLGDGMTAEECNSYIALDYYAKWLEAFRQDESRFLDPVYDEAARMGEVNGMDVQEAVNIVWKRIAAKAYGLSEIDTEFRFMAYMVKSVAVELTREKGEYKMAWKL